MWTHGHACTSMLDDTRKCCSKLRHPAMHTHTIMGSPRMIH
jgi:hypothetical protein